MRPLLVIFLCLCIPLSAAAAERAVTVTPIDTPAVPLAQGIEAPVCIFGNANAAAYAINDFIWGQESYATVFEAPTGGCGCPVGFTVQQVHMYMNFKAADVPASFRAVVGFHETVVDPATGCSVPGPAICTSPVYTVNITTAGLYDIALPSGSCACAFFEYDYAVSVTFPDAFPADKRPDAVTDGAPVGCMSYNDYGAGWGDTTVLGFPGELILFADVACCEPAVGDAETRWGRVKAQYR